MVSERSGKGATVNHSQLLSPGFPLGPSPREPPQGGGCLKRQNFGKPLAPPGKEKRVAAAPLFGLYKATETITRKSRRWEPPLVGRGAPFLKGTSQAQWTIRVPAKEGVGNQ